MREGLQLIEGPVEFVLPVGDSNGLSDDLVHRICDCDPDTSLCGIDLGPDLGWEAGPDDDLCVVCGDLDPLPCERCGE